MCIASQDGIGPDRERFAMIAAFWIEPTRAGDSGLFANNQRREVGESGGSAASREEIEQLAMDRASRERRPRSAGQLGVADRPTHPDRFHQYGPGSAEGHGEIEH